MTIIASAQPASPSTILAPDPPGPRGLPLVGCLPAFLRNPMEALTNIALEYGGIARIPIRKNVLYLVSDPELVRELLITHRNKYMKNIRYRHVQMLLGQGLLLSEALEWRRQRVITQPAFKPEPIHAQVDWMAERTAAFLDQWRASADDGACLDVEPYFIRLAQELAGRFLFGPGFDRMAERFYTGASAIKTSWPLAPRGLWDLLKPKSKKRQRVFDAALAAVDACVYEYIEAQRRRGFDDCGILTQLVRSSEAEGNPFSDLALRDQLFTLFFAGHETSATGLCWIHYFLAKFPDIRARLQREVQTVLGTAVPTAADLSKLHYVEQVVQESLRLYSPIHAISRVALVDNTIGGYRVPAGATVCVSMYATHRLPQYWPDPETFDPDRFTPERCAARSRFAYLPFAAGHRNCIGGGQAMVELKLIVAMLAQRFSLDAAPGHRIEPAPGTTMYPRFGMKMTLRHDPVAL